MDNIDNIEKNNNLDISLSAGSKGRFALRLSEIDSVTLKNVLISYYEFKLLDYTGAKDYDSIKKLEGVLDLLEISESTLLGK